MIWPCPYNTFTSEEWKQIIDSNPFKITKPVLSPSLTSSLLEATNLHALGFESNFQADDTELSKVATRVFNNMYVDSSKTLLILQE